jgi:LytS/YehU family sensor histidine kinase
MKHRFQDSIQVRIDIDSAAQRVMVPSLLLQPLIENAFRHGAGTMTAGGLIEVLGETRNGTLHLVVRDNGPGIPGDTENTARQGVGLSNAAERLRQLYGEKHVLKIRNRFDGGGLEVCIDIPARLSH